MTVEGHMARRALAISAGIAAITASAALNVTHLVEGGQALVSPMAGAVVALALAAVAAALVAGEAWQSGRRLLASCIVLSILAGEGFGFIVGAERLLSAREERQRQASEVNTARWIATVRVEAANSMLAATEAAILQEARRGGCKAACQALQAEAEQARQRLEAANTALEGAPAETNTALLATTLGLPPALLEIVPALLFSAALNGLALTCWPSAPTRQHRALRWRRQTLPVHKCHQCKAVRHRCALLSTRTASGKGGIPASRRFAIASGCPGRPRRFICGGRWLSQA